MVRKVTIAVKSPSANTRVCGRTAGELATKSFIHAGSFAESFARPITSQKNRPFTSTSAMLLKRFSTAMADARCSGARRCRKNARIGMMKSPALTPAKKKQMIWVQYSWNFILLTTPGIVTRRVELEASAYTPAIRNAAAPAAPKGTRPSSIFFWLNLPASRQPAKRPISGAKRSTATSCAFRSFSVYCAKKPNRIRNAVLNPKNSACAAIVST